MGRFMGGNWVGLGIRGWKWVGLGVRWVGLGVEMEWV